MRTGVSTLTKSEERTKDVLVRVGKTGSKTHRGSVRYIIINENKPWEQRQIIDVVAYCSMMGGVGRMYARGITPLFGSDHKDATCEHCKPTA